MENHTAETPKISTWAQSIRKIRISEKTETNFVSDRGAEFKIWNTNFGSPDFHKILLHFMHINTFTVKFWNWVFFCFFPPCRRVLQMDGLGTDWAAAEAPSCSGGSGCMTKMLDTVPGMGNTASREMRGAPSLNGKKEGWGGGGVTRTLALKVGERGGNDDSQKMRIPETTPCRYTKKDIADWQRWKFSIQTKSASALLAKSLRENL